MMTMSTAFRSLLLLTVGAASVLACSSSDSNTAPSDDDGGECSCGFEQRCIDNVCTAVPTMILSLGSGYELGGTPGAESTITFYQPTSTPPTSGVTPTLVSGCYLTTLDTSDGGTSVSSYPIGPDDIGTVTVTGGSNGTDTFVTGAEDAGAFGYSYKGSLGSTPPFTGNETLTASATGGADFPAFQATATARPPVVIGTHDALTTGQPFAITWSGTSPGQMSVLISATIGSQTTSAVCTVPDNGSFTVPADVTAKLPASYTSALAEVFWSNETVVEPTTKNVIIELTLSTSDSVTLK